MARNIRLRHEASLALMVLLGSLPLVGGATGASANAGPHPISIRIAGGATVTSGSPMATITSKLNDLNAAASNISFLPVFITSSIQGGVIGVNATWTNSQPYSRVANVWFAAYTSKNQVVFVSFAQLPFAADGSNTAFQGFSSALPSGTYTVNVFLVSTMGLAVSPNPSISISF